VKAYVKRNKNDAADAEAICEAVRRPTMRFVQVKSAEQQGRLMQHRTRDLLMRQRTQVITAKAEHVCLFHRFDLMRHWHETERLPFKAFVSPDGLHMNDWSYACLAKALGLAIAEAVERPTIR
jgi:hypothetical protein